MLLRLIAALLVVLGAMLFAAGGADGPSRIEQAEARADRQRAVVLTLPARPVPTQPSVTPFEAAPAEQEPTQADPETETDDSTESAAVAQPAPESSDETFQIPSRNDQSQPQDAVLEPSAPTETAEATTETSEPPAEAAPAAQILFVTGDRVNLRSGPSTSNDVVGSVTRGQAVELVEYESNGWAQIRVEGFAVPVFMSGDFLSETQ